MSSYHPDCEECDGSLPGGLARPSCAVCGLGRVIPMGGLVAFIGAVLIVAHFCALAAAIEGVKGFLFPTRRD